MAETPIVNTLEPVILTQNGSNVAPVTVTSHVYDLALGKTVDQILTEIKNTSSTVLFTKVLVLEATSDNQSIFTITYPIDNYDIEQFPLIVFKNNLPLTADCYSVSVNPTTHDQLLLNNAKLDKPLKKGETISIVFHYADTMYNGSIINAQTINNITIIDEQPSVGTVIPDNTIFFDFQNSEIVYYNNGTEARFKIGAIDIIRGSKTITANTQEVQVSIPGYNSAEDTLLVFENNTYIPIGSYYTLDSNLIMRKLNNVMWLATVDEPITFDFLVYKNSTGVTSEDEGNTPSVNVVIPDGAVDESKLSLGLQTYMAEVKQAAESIGNGNNISNLVQAFPVNYVYNSNFTRFPPTMIPDYWNTTGKVTDELGVYSLHMTLGQYCYELATGSEVLNLNNWASKYTRVSFKFSGVGKVKVSVYNGATVKPIRKFSDTAFAPSVEFQSTDKNFWQSSGTLLLEPGTSVASIHFDCTNGDVYIKDVIAHPVFDITSDKNYIYADGMKSYNDISNLSSTDITTLSTYLNTLISK